MKAEARPQCVICEKRFTVDQEVLYYGKLYCAAHVPILRGRQ